jgi:hypothetical protein
MAANYTSYQKTAICPLKEAIHAKATFNLPGATMAPLLNYLGEVK